MNSLFVTSALGCMISIAGLSLGCTRADAVNSAGSEVGTLYVDARSGDDGHNCESAETACRTIQRAADRLRGGGEVVVGPGLYFEELVVKNLGSSRENPVWIRAEPRGSATISGMWEAAAKGRVEWREEGGGLYSTRSGSRLFGMYGGTFLFRFLTVSDLRTATARTRAGPLAAPEYGFAMDGKRLFLRLPGSANPNGESILFSSPSWNDGGGTATVILVEDSPYVILDGFRIEGSGTFCIEFDQKSVGATVRNVILENCRYGLRLPDDSLVEWTEYTYPGFKIFADEVARRNDGKQHIYDLLKDYQPAWMEGGLADSYGRGGTSRDLEFRFNFMHETMDGESLGDFEYSSSHHNVYRRNYDDHVELESWAGHASRELRLYENLFLSAGVISHQGKSIKGPQYVYENVWYFLDDVGREMWTIIKSDAPGATGGIHYRNNLLWSHRSELFWEQRDRATFYYSDNIFVFERNLNHERGKKFNSTRNVLVNDEDKPWLRGKDGRFVGPKSEDILIHSVKPLRFARGPSLAADVGPFVASQSLGPDWPRPARTVFSETVPDRWMNRGKESK